MFLAGSGSLTQFGIRIEPSLASAEAQAALAPFVQSDRYRRASSASRASRLELGSGSR
jgi:hypothetical protein